MAKEFKLEVPRVSHTKVKVYIDGYFSTYATAERIAAFKNNVLRYIKETGDKSVLKRFYFVGHEDGNEKMGKEITITMDERGNFSDFPWEFSHIRRCIYEWLKLINYGKEEETSTE